MGLEGCRRAVALPFRIVAIDGGLTSAPVFRDVAEAAGARRREVRPLRCYDTCVARAKRRNWSGDPPATEGEARRRLIAAALSCADDKGLRRTTLTDIANTAGVTRPTVYAYFSDRHALFNAAFLEATGRLAMGARQAMLSLDSAGERAVEAVAYFVTELPRDPCMRLVLTDEGLSEFMPRAFSTEALALEQAGAILEPMFALAPELAAQRDEVIEVVVRYALSLLSVPGPSTRTDAELRAFLSRRLLPAIGLPTV